MVKQQWVKNLGLSLQQPGSLLRHGFNPWPRNFQVLWCGQKKKKKKKKNQLGSYLCWVKCNLVIFNLFFFLFMITPKAYGSSQARGQIRAADASPYHNLSNARSQPYLLTYITAYGNGRCLMHQVRPGIEPASSGTLYWVLNLLSLKGNSEIWKFSVLTSETTTKSAQS